MANQPTPAAASALKAGNFIIRRHGLRAEKITMAGAKRVRAQMVKGAPSDQMGRTWVDTQVRRGDMFVITAEQAKEFEDKSAKLALAHGSPRAWEAGFGAYTVALVALGETFRK